MVVDVTATNFNYSKVANSLERETAAHILKAADISTDRAYLSTYNLWEAKQQLRMFQQQFRELFGSILGDELTTVETEEERLISGSWLLWHHYAHNPKHTIKDNPSQRVVQRAEDEKRAIDRWIARCLEVFENSGRQATRLSVNLEWDGKPTLAIRLNVSDPTTLYEAFSQLVETLRLQFQGLAYEDMKHYLFREYYERIIVIPAFRGRMANENAWVLYALSTVLSKESITEHHWVSYVPQPLPAEWIEAVGLEFWRRPQIILANRLHALTTELMIRASQVAEFVSLLEMSKVSEAGLKILQEHLSKRAREINELRQELFDLRTTLAEQVEALTERDRMRRTALVKANSIFAQLAEVMIPTNSTTGAHYLDLDQIADYSKRLAEILPRAEFLRLLLISDALSEG